MKPNAVQRKRQLPLILILRPWYGAALCFFLSVGTVSARLTPEDLAAITETGLTALTGEQKSEYPVRDFVVVETMRIARGDTVTFVGGSRIFFHPNARITIFGTLQFLGTAKKKITLGKLPFTLLKLSSDQKMVFDSTSIFAYRQSNLIMRHAVMADSSIKIRLTDSTATFTFDTVTCADNHFMLPDTAFFFPAKSVVTCKMDTISPFIPCVPVLADTTPDLGLSRPTALNPIFPIRIVLGAGIAGAAGVWYYYNNKAQDSYDNYYRGLNSTDPDRERAYAVEQRDLNKSSLLYRNLATVAGLCGIAGFSVTFIFGGHRQ